MAVEQAESNVDYLSPIYRRPIDDPAPSPHKKKEVYSDGDLPSQRKYYSAHLKTSVLTDNTQFCVLQFVCGYLHVSEVEPDEWDEWELEEWHSDVMTDDLFSGRRYRIDILDENMSKKTIERIKREMELKEEGVELYSLWTHDRDDDWRGAWTGWSYKGQIKFLNLERPKFLYFVMDSEDYSGGRPRQNKSRYPIDIHLSTSIDVIEKQEMKYRRGKYNDWKRYGGDDESSGDEWEDEFDDDFGYD